jgi:hypothetical protein
MSRLLQHVHICALRVDGIIFKGRH